MNKNEDIRVGELVISLSGRDKSEYYIVINKDKEFVYYVDGNIRIVRKPKKKKIKHIKRTNIVCEDIALKLKHKESISDKEVISSIEMYMSKLN